MLQFKILDGKSIKSVENVSKFGGHLSFDWLETSFNFVQN